MVQLPSLEPSASIFFLSPSNEASLKLCKKVQRAEAARGPVMPQPPWTVQSTVLGQWGEAQRRKGLPQRGASCLGSQREFLRMFNPAPIILWREEEAQGRNVGPEIT